MKHLLGRFESAFFPRFRFLSGKESNSEGITFILLRCEVEDIICIQTQTESDKNDDGKSDKTCTVVNNCKKGD
jgi:hypothetical protein